MGIETILVAEDEELMRRFLEEALKRKGFAVDAAENGKEAISLLKKNSYDLVITDMKMPDLSGLEILKKTKELSPQTLVLVMTAYGTIENAVEAMRLGAFNYLLKPFTPEAIEALIDKASEHQSLINENTYLREQVASKVKIIAESPLMKRVLEEAVRVAKSQASVLIHGESGTGKEVIAGAIHAHSLRAKNPYIRVNCAAVPDTLIESEFFGHEKGSFTGANSKRLGRFELADGGTLLLDEITEIPLNLQPKLLRVIQEQEFERVGGSRPVSVDVRLISTSNRNLKNAIEEKIFREDLYYRLNVVPIFLPSLRERKEDILPLVRHFLDKFCFENNKRVKILSKKAEEKLLEYHWPGNIRELANVIERVVVLDYGETVEPAHFSLD
ncbi:MAG: sigma-54-dependent Fis family transcriptional regulator [Chlamydiales bacterium]|nr:sigma-54-dependent Fis family transcriptional regulator [Chlamydiales bacterium]